MPSVPYPHGDSSTRPDAYSKMLDAKDAFSTPLSSTIIVSGVPDISNPAKQSLAPLPSLRKSISVDSFMNYRRDLGSSLLAHTVDLDSDFGDPLIPSSSGSSRPTNLISNESCIPPRVNDSAVPNTLSRSRGASLSTVGDKESIVEESDMEQSEMSARLDDGLRRAMSGRVKVRSVTRPGELFLPPRLPTLSSPSSSSSLDGPSSEVYKDPVPSRVAAPRRSTTSATSAMGTGLGRLRSGSLGLNTSQPSQPISIDTHVWAPRPAWPEISIAVVGTSGCGKSTLVRKGLKGYGLSEPTACAVPVGKHGTFNYTFRTGKVPRAHIRHDCVLGVMEVDVPASTLDHVQSASGSPVWPGGAPNIQGVLICYDASDESSFQPVERLLRAYQELKLSRMVVACKSDQERRVEARKAYALSESYDAGVVEVTFANDAGKEKMRRCFDFLLQAIFKDRRVTRIELNGIYRNPASPDVLNSSPPWDMSRSTTSTSTAASVGSESSGAHTVAAQTRFPQSPLVAASPVRSNPTSPTRARSTSDLLSEAQKHKNRERDVEKEKLKPRVVLGSGFSGPMRTGSLHGIHSGVADGLLGTEELNETQPEGREKDQYVYSNGTSVRSNQKQLSRLNHSRPTPWATLEDLLSKLLFLAVSGDDPAFITHFLLTYRRFATPRSAILAMQKRMRELDQPQIDPLFASFSQMRICHLLEMWTQKYPGDFAVPGTEGALSALVNSIIGKTHLLHYGSAFVPFRDALPTLTDKDAAWALKTTTHTYGSDDGDDEDMSVTEIESSLSKPPDSSWRVEDSNPSPPSSRERKPSLPLTAKSLVMPNVLPSVSSSQSDPSDMSPKQTIKELLKILQEVNILESKEIAQEITRIEAKLFLEIQPRHWLHHTLTSGRKEPETDSIACFNQVSSHLADWVVSLILCQDKPKARARQIEKFVDVATHLRRMNNYSALRAFVAGINNSTFQGDETIAIFKDKSKDQYKSLQSYDVLLQSIRSHRAYRMALRNTKGACIPALEVHISDLIRTQEGNSDFKHDDPSKIHWGKFNLMGKFIASTTQCQEQCRTTTDYDFPERPHIRDLLLRECLMDEEMQQSRIAPVPDTGGVDEGSKPPLLRDTSREYSHSTKDPALIKKIFFW